MTSAIAPTHKTLADYHERRHHRRFYIDDLGDGYRSLFALQANGFDEQAGVFIEDRRGQ